MVVGNNTCHLTAHLQDSQIVYITHNKSSMKISIAMAGGPSAAECSSSDPTNPSSPTNNWMNMAHVYITYNRTYTQAHTLLVVCKQQPISHTNKVICSYSKASLTIVRRVPRFMKISKRTFSCVYDYCLTHMYCMFQVIIYIIHM